MKQDQPSYFAIIPANVRYDRDLPAGAKLMYGEITALSNKNGYCFASNGYFSELYGCTKQAISKWIKLLEKGGYVNINYVENNGVSQRRVSISVDTYQPQLMGVSTQVDHNNTSSNKNIVGKPDSAPFHKDVIDYLNASTGSKYRHSTKATKRLVSARAKEGFTLDDFKQVIDTKTAEWKGTTSAKYLRPETLFGTKFESYLNQAASTTVANSDGILNDEQLTDSLQASYNKYIEFVQSECPELYRSECKVLTHSEYRKMAKLVDQPGAFKIPPQARQRLLKKAHIRLNTDEFMRRKYSNVYQLYKEAIRAELNFEKLPI